MTALDDVLQTTEKKQMTCEIKYAEECVFVNVYLEDRAFGGPEEGGWWFDTGEAIRSTQALSGAAATKLLIAEQAWCNTENEGRREISSVLSTGRYAARVELELARDYPEQRPHYE